MTRTTVQYFLILLRSFSISFLPMSSFHLVEDLVNARFLHLYLFQQRRKANTASSVNWEETNVIANAAAAIQPQAGSKVWALVVTEATRGELGLKFLDSKYW